jgi:peptide/nickel transport system ATP-binding protein
VGLGEGVRFTDIPDLREEAPGHWVAPVPVDTVIDGGRA